MAWLLGGGRPLAIPARAAEVAGPSGLELLAVHPNPTALIEQYPLQNRLSLRLKLRNSTGQNLTFESGKAFFLEADGGLIGTSLMGPVEFSQRRKLDGALAFGNGRLTADLVDLTGETLVAMQPDSQGRFVALAYANQLNSAVLSAVVVRFLPTGELDGAFSGDGVRVLGGVHAPVALARFNTDGTPDLNFVGDGSVVQAVGGPSSRLVAFAQDSLQRIVAVRAPTSRKEPPSS